MNKLILKSETVRVLSLLVVSRLLIIIVVYFVAGYIYTNLFADQNLIQFIETFTRRWDGNSYSFLATYGYTTTGPEKYFIVFPPLYPITVKIISSFIHNIELAGFFASNIFYIIGSLVFYKLLRLDYSEKTSLWVIVLLSIFPTSFFFSVSYPESLFLLLLSFTLLSARHNNYLLASTFAAGALLTRPYGILLFVSLFILWLKNKNRSINDLVLILFFLTGSVGVYLSLNYTLFKDPLVFGKLLEENWHKSLAPFWSGITDSFKRGLSSYYESHYRLYIGISEAITSTVAILFALLSFYKKIRLKFSYSVYFLLSVIMFTSTSFILSAPRYLISIPFFFVVLNFVLYSNVVRIAWVVASFTLLIYLATTFSSGQWAF